MEHKLVPLKGYSCCIATSTVFSSFAKLHHSFISLAKFLIAVPLRYMNYDADSKNVAFWSKNSNAAIDAKNG